MAWLSSFFRILRRFRQSTSTHPLSVSHADTKVFFVDVQLPSKSSSQDTLERDWAPSPTSLDPSQPRPRPHAIYDGGYSDAEKHGVRLRIANGGAGQSGLIQAWADAFIQYMVKLGVPPFQVAWYLGDTTESLALLAAGHVDVAVTYNPAAEKVLLGRGDAVSRVYGFRDHFLLVGPHCNPASLRDDEDVFAMFSKIVAAGDSDAAVPPDPDIRPPTRFLSRFDKSATNIKESQIFLTIGQVPWALTYSKWYHQYPQFPFEALKAAAALSEYTLIDLGSWLCAPKAVSSALRPYKIGSDDESDILLNPAHVLLGKASASDDISNSFMNWIISPQGGQKIVQGFSRNGHVLYTRAPQPFATG